MIGIEFGLDENNGDSELIEWEHRLFKSDLFVQAECFESILGVWQA